MRVLRTGITAVVVTFVCALGLVLGAAAPANAYIDGGELLKGATKGAKVGGPASLLGKWSNPVGWGITAGGIAWGVWSTKDSWLGLDTDKSMKDYCDSGYVALSGSAICQSKLIEAAGWTSTGVQTNFTASVTMDGPDVVFDLKCTGTTGTWRCGSGGNRVNMVSSVTKPGYDGLSYGWCRPAAGGAVRQVTWGSSNSQSPGVGGAGQPLTLTWTKTLCNVDEVVVGFLLAPRNGSGGTQVFGLRVGKTLVDELGKNIGFGNYRVTTRCVNPETMEAQDIVTTTPGAEGGIVLPSCSARLGEGWHAAGVTIAPEAPEIDGEPLPEEWEVPDFPPIGWDELIPSDPDWEPCMGDKKGCTLGVVVDDIPCVVGGSDACKQWVKILQKEPNRVRCEYGGVRVKVEDCYPLAYYYDVNTETNVDTSTPTKPETGPGPTTPKPDAPGTGTTTNVPLPDPESEAAKGECFPKGWSVMNPVEWVYKPVKCALTWAFVPKTPLDVRLSRMKDKLGTRAPFGWIMSLTNLPGAIPGGSCPNWRIEVGGMSKNVVCNSTFTGAIRSARPVLAALMIGGAIWPMTRSLLYASVPVIKPVPTR